MTQYYKLNIYFNLSVYISRDFSLPLAIEMHGGHFFPGHLYIESTTVLSDIYNIYNIYNYIYIYISINKYIYILESIETNIANIALGQYFFQ